jgi:hypothetical protein
MAKQPGAKTQINCRFDEDVISEIDRRRGSKNRSAFCQELISNAMAGTHQSTNTTATDLSKLADILTDFQERLITEFEPVTADMPSIVQSASRGSGRRTVSSKNLPRFARRYRNSNFTILMTAAGKDRSEVEAFVAKAFPNVERYP